MIWITSFTIGSPFLIYLSSLGDHSLLRKQLRNSCNLVASVAQKETNILSSDRNFNMWNIVTEWS